MNQKSTLIQHLSIVQVGCQYNIRRVPVQYRTGTSIVHDGYFYITGQVPVQYWTDTCIVQDRSLYSIGRVPVQYRTGTMYLYWQQSTKCMSILVRIQNRKGTFTVQEGYQVPVQTVQDEVHEYHGGRYQVPVQYRKGTRYLYSTGRVLGTCTGSRGQSA